MLARLLFVLASLVVSVAAGEVSISPLRTPSPKVPASPDPKLELAAALAIEAPHTGGGEVRVRPAQTAAPLRRTFLGVIKDLPKFGGDRSKIPAVVIERGSLDLRQLAADPALEGYLTCEGRRCTLDAPLHVGRSATLVIRDVTLGLKAAGGTFIASNGRLHVEDSTIASLPGHGPPGQSSARFRPFLVAQAGSETVILRSTLRDLGFAAAESYGLTLTSGTPTPGGAAAPTGTIAGNRLEGLFRGLYTHGATGLAFLGNTVRDSIDYGIDPHDHSSGLLIAANRVVGSGRHGLIASRRVAGSWMLDNVVEANRGSGIVLDRQVTGMVIGHNRVTGNAGDGIAIYESPGNVVIGNSVTGNRRAGLRIRNSVEILAIDNDLHGNLTHGLIAYAATLEDRPRRTDDPYLQRTSLGLVGNRLTGNGSADLKLMSVDRLDVFGRLDAAGHEPTISGDAVWVRALTGQRADTRFVFRHLVE